MAINWKPTAKQKLFIAEYMVDRNATQAAIRAGYAPKYADRQGYQLLGINGVKALIDDQLEKQIKKAELTAAKVDEVLAGMILTNNSDLYTEGPDGTMVPKSADNLTDRQKMSVQEITLMTGADGSGYQRIKQYDKLKAIDIYSKRAGAYSDAGTVNNIANMHVNILDYNKAMRRIGEKEIED